MATPKFFDSFFAGLPEIDGKVVVVTGCTGGVGLVFAKACAEKGAVVALLNRPSARAEEALKSVQAKARNKALNVACDLMDFASVRSAAQQLRDVFGASGIDVLCNNAGVMAMADVATKDGCDIQMQTNHLSHFLLSAELFPLLEKAAAKNGEARIVNQSSLARKAGGLHLDAKYFGKNGGNLGGDPGGVQVLGQGPQWVRYQQSKLANVAFTYALNDRLAAKGSKVKALCAHPGVALTGLQAASDAVDADMAEVIKGRAQAMEDGALGILLCACQAGVKSGEFYGPTDNEGRGGVPNLMPNEDLATPESRDLLWKESEQAVGVVFTITGPRSAM